MSIKNYWFWVIVLFALAIILVSNPSRADEYVYTAPVDLLINVATANEHLNMTGNVAKWTNNGYIMGSFTDTQYGVSIRHKKLRRHNYVDV